MQPDGSTSVQWLAAGLLSVGWAVAGGTVGCEPVTVPGAEPQVYGDNTGDPGDTGPADTGQEPDVVDEGAVSAVEAAVHAQIATVVEVTWTQDDDADASWIEYSFDGSDDLTTPPVARGAGQQREVLLGVPADTDVTFRVVSEIGGKPSTGLDHTITTGSLPWGLTEATVLEHQPTLASPDRWLLGSVDAGTTWYYGPFWLFILDREGRYVWYHQVDDNRAAMFTRVSRDGTHIVHDATTNYTFGDSYAAIYRLTLDLTTYDELVLDDFGFTYDELPDGSLLYDDNHNNSSEGWQLMHRAQDGTETVVWNCLDWLDVNPSSWDCFPNAINWVEHNNSALWSMFEIDTVVEIDLDSGEMLGQWGQLDGSWTFDPPDSSFDWQHYPTYGSADTLLVSAHLRVDRSEQRALEYRIDPDSQTLTEVWSYGEGVDRYATYSGEAHRLPNGNTLINYGTGGALREVTPDGQLAWEVEWDVDPVTHLTGHTMLIDDLYALNQGIAATE